MATKRDAEQGLDDAKKEEGPPNKKQETSKGSSEPTPDSVEEGRIYFLYRPRVGFEEVKSISDIQRFYLVLDPKKGGEKKRLIVIGKKKLPAAKERYFGFVERVSKDVSDLTGGLSEDTYETKTSGTRHISAGRIAGEGQYSIVKKQGSSTHLVWKTEVPADPGKVQEDLGIGSEGSLSLSIKNPKKSNPAGNVGLDEKADFGEKQKLFDGTPGGYAWIEVKDATLLDHENCEILLIGSTHEIEETFGDGLKKDLEKKVEEDKDAKVSEHDEDEEAKLVEEMRKEIKAEQPGLEDAPAKEKDWK